jgi:hypothetical protein
MRALVLLLCLPFPALADDWQVLDDADITAALSARVLGFEDGASQNVFSDGRSLYRVSSRESWGK